MKRKREKHGDVVGVVQLTVFIGTMYAWQRLVGFPSLWGFPICGLLGYFFGGFIGESLVAFVGQTVAEGKSARGINRHVGRDEVHVASAELREKLKRHNSKRKEAVDEPAPVVSSAHESPDDAPKLSEEQVRLLEELWHSKADSEVQEAAKSLSEYTEAARRVIQAEFRRRGFSPGA